MLQNDMGAWQKYIKILLLAVLAGITIAIGGCIYLSLDNKIAGALLFTVGLYAICIHGLKLYTGRIGYLINESPVYLLELAVIWIGNFLGTFLAAMAMKETRISAISEKAAKLCQVKLDDGLSSLFLLGVFCGLLMFVAVDGYRAAKNPIILFMGVSAFILCGFEHCIADMFYFSAAGLWSGRSFIRILVITLGNSIGGMLIPLVKKIPDKNENDIKK